MAHRGHGPSRGRRRTSRSVGGEALKELQRAASLVSCAHIFPSDFYSFPMEETRREWEQTLSASEKTVVAERAGIPVGVIASRSAYVHSLFVAPEERRRGIRVGNERRPFGHPGPNHAPHRSGEPCDFPP